jgi:hypothetical protein
MSYDQLRKAVSEAWVLSFEAITICEREVPGGYQCQSSAYKILKLKIIQYFYHFGSPYKIVRQRED